MRAGSRPQYRRLRRIVGMLKAAPRSGRMPTMADFQRELEASRRTIARDLDFLRLEENAPIAYDPRAGGYRLTDESFALPPVEMSQGDLANLAAARAALGGTPSLPTARAVDGVLGKIAEAAPARIEPAIWSILAQAVAGCLVVAARYRRFDGAERDYVIEPLRLVAHRGNWYALASKRPGSELRAFALSRFASATPTGETFPPPKHFDWCRAAKDTFGIGLGGRPTRVRILFSKTVSAAITERVWHPSQQILHRQDGKVELRLRAVPGIELVRWILSWTPDVRVLAPKGLRDRVQRYLRNGCADALSKITDCWPLTR